MLKKPIHTYVRLLKGWQTQPLTIQRNITSQQVSKQIKDTLKAKQDTGRRRFEVSSQQRSREQLVRDVKLPGWKKWTAGYHQCISGDWMTMRTERRSIHLEKRAKYRALWYAIATFVRFRQITWTLNSKQTIWKIGFKPVKSSTVNSIP